MSFCISSIKQSNLDSHLMYGQRQRKAKDASFTEFAFYTDFAAVLLDNRTSNRQAKPGAFGRFVVFILYSVEAIKQMGKGIFRDAHACI